MKLNYTKTMKKFSLLMAAIASLFLMGCQKSNYYENAIIGSWESYSRSRTLLKNGAPVSAETHTSTYSIQGDKLFIETPDDPSILMRVNIVKITESELVISTVVKETIWIEEPLVPLGYSTLNQIRFTKK